MAPSPIQIAIVILLIFLVFGAKRLPGIAENMAKGIKSFKKGLKDEGDVSESPNPQILESQNKDDA